jgi:catechol 2,3-dioxygenase-like lactoylglutathione lyase family enzyme/ketosteroid isomerase-like protein
MTTTTDDVADRAAVAAVRAALEAAENAADADALAELLADDVVAMVPDFPAQEGKAACTAFMRDVMGELAARFIRRVAYESDEVSVLGDAAFDRGTFAFTVAPRSGGDTSRVTGKYFWLLQRRAAAGWRVTRLIVSRDEGPEEDDAGVRQSLAHVALVVRDYDEAIAFYCGPLGFTLVEDTYQPEQDKRWVVVAPPGSRGTTVLLARASTPDQARAVGNQTGGRVFLFLRTDDFWRDYETMRSAGVRFVREPRDQPYGTVAVFADLYGNLWDLVGPPPG